jgi:hypothetical protein
MVRCIKLISSSLVKSLANRMVESGQGEDRVGRMGWQCREHVHNEEPVEVLTMGGNKIKTDVLRNLPSARTRSVLIQPVDDEVATLSGQADVSMQLFRDGVDHFSGNAKLLERQTNLPPVVETALLQCRCHCRSEQLVDCAMAAGLQKS